MIGRNKINPQEEPQPMDPFCNQDEMGLFTFYHQQDPSPPFPCLLEK